MKKLIKVTEDHIGKGTTHISSCPVALALKDVGLNCSVWGNGGYYHAYPVKRPKASGMN